MFRLRRLNPTSVLCTAEQLMPKYTFVANTSNVRKSVKATFRQQGLQAEWWDPFSGSVAAAKIDAATEKGTTITLDLEPYASRVLVFARRTLPSWTNDSLEHVKAD